MHAIMIMKKRLLLIFAFAMLLLGVSAQNHRGSGESGVIKLNKALFLKRVINYEKNPNKWVYLGDKPAVIDFYADWCGPCRRLSPIIEELAKEYSGEIYFYKINVDNEKELAETMGISSLPTLVFAPMKGTPSATTGYLPKDALKGVIDDVLLEKSNKKIKQKK